MVARSIIATTGRYIASTLWGLPVKSILLASTVFFGLAGAAVAADTAAAESVPEEVLAPAFNWTGGYVGAQVGYEWSRGDMTFTTGDYANPKPDGFLGGIYGGANYQFSNNLVVGVDADIAWGQANNVAPFYDENGNEFPFPDNSGSQDVKWSGAVRGRLGYAYDRWLPYLAGGVAFAHVKQSVVSGFATLDYDTKNYTGWTLGAGVEYTITTNLIGRFEYRYTDFGSHDFPAANGYAPITTKLHSNDVRVGIAYKF